MYESFQYDLKSRFYGMFSQWPWSLVLTLIVLSPFVYFSDNSTRVLVLELTIYWACLIGVIMLLKDLTAQKYLFEFSVRAKGIAIHKQAQDTVHYRWEQITTIKPFTKNHVVAKRAIETEGVLIKFEDGFELPVFKPVKNYHLLHQMLNGLTGLKTA